MASTYFRTRGVLIAVTMLVAFSTPAIAPDNDVHAADAQPARHSPNSAATIDRMDRKARLELTEQQKQEMRRVIEQVSEKRLQLASSLEKLDENDPLAYIKRMRAGNQIGSELESGLRNVLTVEQRRRFDVANVLNGAVVDNFTVAQQTAIQKLYRDYKQNVEEALDAALKLESEEEFEKAFNALDIYDMRMEKKFTSDWRKILSKSQLEQCDLSRITKGAELALSDEQKQKLLSMDETCRSKRQAILASALQAHDDGGGQQAYMKEVLASFQLQKQFDEQWQEVLTDEQRAKLEEHLEKQHGP